MAPWSLPGIKENEEIVGTNAEYNEHGQHVEVAEVLEPDHHTVDKVGLHEATHYGEHPKARYPQGSAIPTRKARLV